MITKTDDMKFLRTYSNWDLYQKGVSVFAIAKSGSGCESTFFGSLKYYQRLFTDKEKARPASRA